ncbi:MAG: hypothetical protein ACE5IY_20595, partial [bacterium]
LNLEYSIVNEDPESITALRTDVPMELEKIVNKCLEKEPSERYQQVDELRTDLRPDSTELRSVPTRVKLSRIKPGAIVVFTTILVLTAIAFFGYWFKKETPIAGNSVAIMYFENQTGEPANDNQVNTIIPQVYKKLFASHKNVSLASPAVKRELETVQRAATIDKIAAAGILDDARIKYRVAAIVQESEGGLDHILEMTRPGEQPIVWQETLFKPDSIAQAGFSQKLADWIDACIWVDQFEPRLHKEMNFRHEYTTRELFTNWLKNDVLATREFYKGWYHWLSSPSTGSEAAIPYFERALQIDPDELRPCLLLCVMVILAVHRN